jgi:CysZ protein
MIDAAIKALAQMLSPEFRSVLLKAVALAVALLVVIGIGLHHVLVWFVGAAGAWLEAHAGQNAHAPVEALEWVLAILAGLGLAAGAVFLMPTVTSLVGSFFVDEIAEHVERRHYPADPPGAAVPLARALLEGIKTALLAFLVYACAVPFLLVAGIGVLIFFVANAYLLGRIYFELAAMRFHSAAEAKRLRRLHQSSVFIGGMFIAAFVSIPIANLATPLFGTAFMVHLHKRLAERTESIGQRQRI